MTAAALAQVLCLASTIYGRASWDAQKCAEHASYIMEAAKKYDVEPSLMAAIEIWECDMRDRDLPAYKTVRGRRRLVGYDACPMGVRVLDVAKRRTLGPADLYAEAAARLSFWKRWHGRGHPGGRYEGTARHHYVAHYNPGSPEYSHQVLAVQRAVEGKHRRSHPLTIRGSDIVRRLERVFLKKDIDTRFDGG